MTLTYVEYIILANMNEQLCCWAFNSQIVEGSAATDLRWSGRFYSSFFCSLSENAAVKELLKLVNIWVINDENMKRMFFMEHPVD